jgi:hypothetical protein
MFLSYATNFTTIYVFPWSQSYCYNDVFSQSTLQLSAQKRKLNVIKVNLCVSFLCKCRTLVSGLSNLKSDFVGFSETVDTSIQEHCRLFFGFWNYNIFFTEQGCQPCIQPPSWWTRSLCLCTPVAGWPNYTPGLRFNFCCLLRLSGLQWEHSNLPPHGAK